MNLGRGFIWTDAKRRAVDLEDEGRQTQSEIACELGVSRRTVEGWLRRKAVRAVLHARQEAANVAFFTRMRAQYALKVELSARARAEMAAKSKADAERWVAWKMACHAARAAHRKLPPMPPGLA